MLVGPSGSGKSTALRMLAGLEPLDAGRILIAERDVSAVRPRDRDIAMVFQNYALYPQLDVAANMGFALKQQGVPKEERRQRVREAAKLLDLEPYLDRKPRNLSGGQRQRVAMGRAIVRRPQVYLMDEPLSNLDAKLRVQTRTELVELQSRLAVTTVYVTHDQVEAMTMGAPRGGAAGRHPAAVRHARDALPRAGQPLRRGVHRLARHEPAARLRDAVRCSSPAPTSGSPMTSAASARAVGFRPEAVVVGAGPIAGADPRDRGSRLRGVRPPGDPARGRGAPARRQDRRRRSRARSTTTCRSGCAATCISSTRPTRGARPSPCDGRSRHRCRRRHRRRHRGASGVDGKRRDPGRPPGASQRSSQSPRSAAGAAAARSARRRST